MYASSQLPEARLHGVAEQRIAFGLFGQELAEGLDLRDFSLRELDLASENDPNLLFARRDPLLVCGERCAPLGWKNRASLGSSLLLLLEACIRLYTLVAMRVEQRPGRSV